MAGWLRHWTETLNAFTKRGENRKRAVVRICLSHNPLANTKFPFCSIYAIKLVESVPRRDKR
jgi:hypothetical protein